MAEAKTVIESVLKLESEAISQAIGRLEDSECQKLKLLFENLLKTRGSLFFVGVGKSGHVGVKLASTFSSLGLRSFFIHPTEALHGDLGRVSHNDALVVISYSGHSEEVVKFLNFCKVPKEMRIGLIGASESPLRKEVGIFFNCQVEKEACVNNQAPTTSTTLSMAMGDAIAVYFESLVGLSKEGFALNHPAGLLGKTLSLKVSSLMIDPDNCPVLTQGSTIKEAIIEMTRYPVGACAIVDDSRKLLGILVEGDFRRFLASENIDMGLKVESMMNVKPVQIQPDAKALHAMELMEKREKAIDVLPVVENQKFLGFLRLHDLLKEGFGEHKK